MAFKPKKVTSKIRTGTRIPPQDIDSERALLGSIMLKPQSIYDISDFITPDSFYTEKHRLIFRAMSELTAKSEPIDFLSVSSWLKGKKSLPQAGGKSYLTELVNFVPSASNIKYYATLIYKKSILRSLIDASTHISEMGYDEGQELDDILDSAEKKIFKITSSPSTQKFVTIKDALNEAWERIDKLSKNTDELRGVPTGFKELDTMLAGLQPADLIILAARPSMGKTTLALDIARQTACDFNIPVGFFSLEMSNQQLVDRILSAQSRVDSWKLRTGKLSKDEEFVRIRNALDTLSKAPIFIDDQAGTNIVKMKSVARRLKSEHGLGLIIVDYLQLMSTSKNYESMVHQVTEISRSLKGLARELQVPVLALSQLSRAVEARGGRPRLSDLRDSGSIEQDADVVMFIHREDKYKDDTGKPNIAEIMIEKHRNGPTGKIELYFDEKRTTFLSLDKNEAHANTDEKEFDDF